MSSQSFSNIKVCIQNAPNKKSLNIKKDGKNVPDTYKQQQQKILISDEVKLKAKQYKKGKRCCILIKGTTK